MKQRYSITELFIDEENGLDGVGAMSMVSTPAMESEFMLFNKHFTAQFKTIDEDRQIVMGAALIPNKMILRKFEDGTHGYVYFSEETIRKTRDLFFKNSNQNNTTLEHLVELENLTVVESWIIEDLVHEKSVKFGMQYPIGTWMIAMKIDDKELWDDVVKTGMVKGFSIEGKYAMGNPKLSKEESTEDVELFNKIKDLIANIEEN